MELELVLPSEIEKKLEEESEKMEISVEGLVLDALVKGMNEEIDPADRAELYLRLSEKYLKDGEELLAKGDLVQASE